MAKRANGRTGIDKIICEMSIKKYAGRNQPSPPYGTGGLDNFEITYDTKNTADKTKALIIAILCKAIFLFFSLLF